jgi:multidrug efflux pump subunit AcrB
MTREEISTGGQTAIIFLLSILFVYFILSAQYESYILPLAVIFTIPAGILGVFTFIKIAVLKEYLCTVGLIMLVGLLSKMLFLLLNMLCSEDGRVSIIDAALQARVRLADPDDVTRVYCGLLPWFGQRRLRIG